ncbi:hypothetical protein [Streptomyces sp. NRRL WC-3742]|uniref:hypothetical protein n=1 Tax=Streptomyces sp. NRRL WC-3742 TaxID=1463934 RepID=UPI0004CAB243|nr:hypothetical protein [Streptomyces sp. NRRL WC-3742]
MSADTEPDPRTVTFRSADGRERAYVFAELPCPGLHDDVQHAFTATLGQASALATSDQYFSSLRRFLSFLDTLGEPFAALSELRVRHFEQYRASRAVTVSQDAWGREVSVLFRLLKNAPYGSLSPELGDQVIRPGHLREVGVRVVRPRSQPVPLYSRRELDRLLAAARTDAARTAAPGGPGLEEGGLAPMLVLATALSALRASEIHDLSAEHTMADSGGRAVLVRAHLARQPGSRTLTWAVGGGEGDWLRQAGDFYLMVHRLTAHARRASGSDRLWCVWTPSGPRVPAGPSLARFLSGWAADRRLSGDDGRPLALTLPRLRSTVRVAAAG